MLIKLTTGVNFINILQAVFSYETVLFRFSVHPVCICIFLQKEIGAKVACKMLVKLTIGILAIHDLFVLSKILLT